MYLGTVHYLRGELKESSVETSEALDSAVYRGDVQTQILTMTALARNYWSLKVTFIYIEKNLKINFYSQNVLKNLRMKKEHMIT